LQVLFGTKNQDPTNSNFTVIATLSKLSKQYAWIDTSFSVSSISDSGYLAFRYITIGAAWATYTIDSITISEKPNGIINPATPVKLSISPNPTTNNCVVSTTSNCVNAAINLYDFSGKCVHQISNANGNLFNLQVADLANGIYIIEIIQEKNKIATGKFEICH
jgi:hypothetical protein